LSFQACFLIRLRSTAAFIYCIRQNDKYKNGATNIDPAIFVKIQIKRSCKGGSFKIEYDQNSICLDLSEIKRNQMIKTPFLRESELVKG